MCINYIIIDIYVFIFHHKLIYGGNGMDDTDRILQMIPSMNSGKSLKISDRLVLYIQTLIRYFYHATRSKPI